MLQYSLTLLVKLPLSLISYKEPELKVLLSDVLNEIEPVKVIAKEKGKPTGMSLYKNEKYFPKRDQLGTSAKDYNDKSSGAE